MPGPEGFDYEVVGGTVTITLHGRRATVLRGRRAEQFLDDVERDDPQELMARLTGNYKGGATSGGPAITRATRDADSP